MKTKNIQDVVTERVEELIDVFKDRFHMTSATKADEEAEKRLFDPIRASLTTTLTQLVKEVEAGEREIRFQMMEQIRHDVNMTLYNDKYPQREGLQQALVKDFTATPPTSDVTEK